LQKSGRLGRIDVELNVKENKTFGTISVPTGLDQATSALLAAAIETIDRVGPYNCKVQLESIDDIREKRRKLIVDRAKQILQRWSADRRTDSAEALKAITQVAKVPEIVSFGPDNVPAGPEAVSSRELIVVEGRADVANLLKAGYRNGVAVEGVTVPKSVVDLTWKKDKVTALIDGDRVGDMILRELARVGKVDFVAKAPKGREVEELSPSELIDLLDRRQPLADYLARLEKVSKEPAEEHLEERAPKVEVRERAPREVREKFSAEIKEKLKPYAESVQNRLTSFIIGSDGKVLAEVPVIELVEKLKDMDGVHFIVMDGIVTQRLLDIAQSKQASMIVGERIGELERRPPGISIATLKEILS